MTEDLDERATDRAPAGLRPAPELRILSTRVFRGPNVWHYEPAIQLVVELGVLEDFPTNLLPGFADRLLEALPVSRTTAAVRGRKGGFVERLHEGTWLGHVAEHVALQLQQEVGHDLRRGKTRGVKGERGRYNVIYAYADETVGVAAGELAVRLVNHLVQPDAEFDFADALETFIVRGERDGVRPVDPGDPRRGRRPRHPLHPAQLRLARPARAGRPPAADPGHDDLAYLLGGRRHRLQQGADPVAAGRRGPAGPAFSAVRRVDDAVALARRIGFPVVVKPLDGNHGRGVCLDLRDDDAVRSSFRHRRGRVPQRLGDRRVLRHRQGLPVSGDRRQDRRDRGADAGARDRRRGRPRSPR